MSEGTVPDYANGGTAGYLIRSGPEKAPVMVFTNKEAAREYLQIKHNLGHVDYDALPIGVKDEL